MTFKPIKPEELKSLLKANWQVVGFSQGVLPSERPGEQDATDGYAILLRFGSELALIKYAFNGWMWTTEIAYLTREVE
jgi:hypothetical protein